MELLFVRIKPSISNTYIVQFEKFLPLPTPHRIAIFPHIDVVRNLQQNGDVKYRIDVGLWFFELWKTIFD